VYLAFSPGESSSPKDSLDSEQLCQETGTGNGTRIGTGTRALAKLLDSKYGGQLIGRITQALSVELKFFWNLCESVWLLTVCQGLIEILKVVPSEWSV